MNGKWALSAKDEGTLGLSDVFCPAWYNQEALCFFHYYFFWSALPGVFLSQFLRILAMGLAGPRCRSVCVRLRAPLPGVWLDMQITRLPAFFCLPWSVWFSTQPRLDSSGPHGCFWRRSLSSITSPAVTVVRPCSANAALLQQSPIGVKHSRQRENELKWPSTMVIVRGLGDSRKFSVFINIAACCCSFNLSYLLNPTLAPAK